MLLETQPTILTTQVLKSIAYHLSSREDCKDVEYVVTIKHDKVSGYDTIVVSPYITVFPDIHTRKESDRRSVAYHVISHHFPDILETSSNTAVNITAGTLILGKYKYQKFKLTCRRKWKKL